MQNKCADECRHMYLFSNTTFRFTKKLKYYMNKKLSLNATLSKCMPLPL